MLFAALMKKLLCRLKRRIGEDDILKPWEHNSLIECFKIPNIPLYSKMLNVKYIMLLLTVAPSFNIGGLDNWSIGNHSNDEESPSHVLANGESHFWWWCHRSYIIGPLYIRVFLQGVGLFEVFVSFKIATDLRCLYFRDVHLVSKLFQINKSLPLRWKNGYYR